MMAPYQIRDGKPAIGHYTDKPITPEEYRTMRKYLESVHKKPSFYQILCDTLDGKD